MCGYRHGEVRASRPGFVLYFVVQNAFVDGLSQLFASRAVSRAPSLPVSLGEVQLNVNIRLGATTLPLRDIYKWTIGSVIEMGQTAGEPVEILVQNRVIARGLVVVCDGSYGIRIISKERKAAGGVK
jgi:flagellar motor switch protein FliN